MVAGALQFSYALPDMANLRSGHWDLARLQTFVDVAAEGNLTRVAAATGSPQPFISRQIARLEQECQGRLFLRTGRGVVLSDLGHRLLPKVQALLREAEDLAATVQALPRTPVGSVSMGTIPSLYLTLVVPLFQHIRSRYPGVRLRVLEGSGGQIDQWLATGAVDVGVMYRYGKLDAAEAEPLAQIASYLIGPRGDQLTARKTVPFAKLDGLPLVLPGAPSSVRLRLDQLARRAGIRLDVVLEADSGQIQRAVTMNGGAYAVAALHSIQPELSAGSLQAARIVGPQIQRTVAMGITAARPASPAVRETAKAIRQLFAGAEMRTRLRIGEPPGAP